MPIIQSIAGPAVTVIDPAAAVARELRRRLEAIDGVSRRGEAGAERFWTSGSPASVHAVLARLWPGAASVSTMTADC
jgi:glutamate racemase